MQVRNRRAIAFVLALMMLVTMFPMSAFADVDLPDDPKVTIRFATEADAETPDIASGTAIAVFTSGSATTYSAISLVASNTYGYDAKDETAGVNIVVDVMSGPQILLGGTIGTLTLNDSSAVIENVTLKDDTTVNELEGFSNERSQIQIAAGATVEIDGVTYKTAAGQGEMSLSNKGVLAGNGHFEFTGNDVTVEQVSGAELNVSDGTNVTAIGNTTAITLNGDINTLTTENAKVTVNGDVAALRQEKAGTSTVTISGILGGNPDADAAYISSGTAIVSAEGLVGTFDTYYDDSANADGTAEVKIANELDVKLAKGAEIKFDSTEGNGTLTLVGSDVATRGAVTNQSASDSIAYDVLIKAGKVDFYPQKPIAGTLTFDNDYASTLNDTTGKDYSKSVKVYLAEGSDNVSDIVFKPNSAGFVLQYPLPNKQEEGQAYITIGDGAYAAFSTLVANNKNIASIGKGAWVNLGNSELDNTAIELAAENNTVANGNTATFFLWAKTTGTSPAAIISDISIPEGASIKLQSHDCDVSAYEMDDAITVGAGAKLEITGESGTQLFTITGSSMTAVYEGATLVLNNVNHQRTSISGINGDGSIYTKDGATIEMNASTKYFVGGEDVSGKFETKHDPDTAYGVPTTISGIYSSNLVAAFDATTDAAYMAINPIFASTSAAVEGSSATAVFYTGIKFTSEEAVSGEYVTYAYTLQKSTFDLADDVDWSYPITYVDGSVSYTTNAAAAAIADPEGPTTAAAVSTASNSAVVTAASINIYKESGRAYATLDMQDMFKLYVNVNGLAGNVGNAIQKAGVLGGDKSVEFGPLKKDSTLQFTLKPIAEQASTGATNPGTTPEEPIPPVTTEGAFSSEITYGAVVVTPYVQESLNVVLTDGYYKANFVANANSVLTITLGKDAHIAPRTTFDIREGATLKIVGDKDAVGTATPSTIMAPIIMENDNTTLILENVVLDNNYKEIGEFAGNPDPDQAPLEIAAGADNVKVIVDGDVKVNGTHGAQAGKGDTDSTSSVAIKNAGDLTITVAKGATLSAIGGKGAQGSENNATIAAIAMDSYQGHTGGSGVYNLAGANLTFAGAGNINITGGEGGIGGHGVKDDVLTESVNGTTVTGGSITYSKIYAACGGIGGTGGVAVLNNGKVTVAMDSKTWNEGQLVVIGGTGGVGGNGCMATQAACNFSASATTGSGWNANEITYFAGYDYVTKYTVGGAAGNGGNSGFGVHGGDIAVEKGVLLAYSGNYGIPGCVGLENNSTSAGNAYYYRQQDSTDSSKWNGKGATCDGHSVTGATGTNGSDNKHAVAVQNLTINGGTTLAFSGDDINIDIMGGNVGVKVAGTLTVNGGSAFGGCKTATTGYDHSTIANADENMQPVAISTAGITYGAITQWIQDVNTYMTRIKTGTEGEKYIVESFEYTPHNRSSLNYNSYNTGMYVNEQGFVYAYLPDGDNEGDKATLILKKDSDTETVYLQMTAGGKTDVYTASNAAAMYGFGNVSSSVENSNLNYDGESIWTAEFTDANGVVRYNGVDMTFAEALKTTTGSVTIDTPEKLAAVAYVLNNGLRADDFANVTFVLANDINISMLTWTPIGTTTGNAFKGVFNGNGYSIRGLRMPEAYDDEVFGLFGYTDGATIYNLTVDNNDIAGKAYTKTVKTNLPQGETLEGTQSGGQYKWTAEQMKWEANADNVGTFVGYAKGTTIYDCHANTVWMAIDGAYTDSTIPNTGGLVGHSTAIVDPNGKAVSNTVIYDCDVIGVTVGAISTANAGGLVSIAENTTFYRNFVRGGALSIEGVGGAMGSFVVTASAVEMYGNYTQALGGTHAAAVVYSNDSTFVGCYTTQEQLLYSRADITHTGSVCYNCYSSGSAIETYASDSAIGVKAETLKNAGMSDMNSELLATEIYNAPNKNDSEFAWAEFGEPIAYVPDTANVNNGYPVFGTPFFVEVYVTEGAIGYGYGRIVAASGTDNIVINADVTDNGDYASYWVISGSSIKLNMTPLVDLVESNNASYKIDATTTTVTITDNVNESTQVGSSITITTDTSIVLDFTPQTYTLYTVDLKTAGGDESYDAGTGSTTIVLNGSEVHKYTSEGTPATTGSAAADDDVTIHTVILTIDNGGSLGVPATPEGWDKAASSSATYYHYNISDGTSVGAVQAFLKGVTVTPVNKTADFRVSAFVSEKDVAFITANYGGHFYQYNPAGTTWKGAYDKAASFSTTLGKADTYLATITSRGENDYLYGPLHAVNAWIGAVYNDGSADVVGLGISLPAINTWGWVTGPEKGTDTWIYAGTTAVGGPWRNGEPNHCGNAEWAAAFAYGGWNDWNDFDGDRSYGYIVEYQAGQDFYGSTYANDYFIYSKDYYSRPSRPSSDSGNVNTGDVTILTPWTPDKTGVDQLLITDHIKYLNGYPDGTFQAKGNMTRAEVAQMFYNLLLNKEVAGNASFADVKDTAWYADAVYTLANMGILEGSNGKYEPNRDITRAEFVAIAMRFANTQTDGVRQFSDVKTSHWAYDEIMSSTGFGWINGYDDGTFRPNASITRAEVANIVNNMLGRDADEAYVNANLASLITFPDLKASYWAYYDIMEATNAHDYELVNGVETWK